MFPLFALAAEVPCKCQLVQVQTMKWLQIMDVTNGFPRPPVDKKCLEQILPQWAQKTLTAHQGDKRDVKTLKQLEDGTTGDEIWDALQHQLNKTGEPALIRIQGMHGEFSGTRVM